MKFIASLFVVVSTLSMAADRPNAITPNLYNCEGDQVRMHYTTSSIAGIPMISFNFQGTEYRSQGKDKISTENSRIGQVVSVSNMKMVMVDGPEVRYSVVLPYVELSEMTNSAEFETVLVRTSVVNPFMRPRPFNGGNLHNTFVPVKCTAQHVWF